MFRTLVVPLIAIVLALAAALICTKLLEKHIDGKTASSWFEAGCSSEQEEGGADCAKVLSSRYSYFPPLPEDRSNAKQQIRLPVAFLGQVYYSVIAVWLIGIGAPSRSRRWVQLAPMLLLLGGLFGSACYTYIMLSVLTEWCPWCLATHIVNVLIAVCFVLMYPRASKEHASRQESKVASSIDQKISDSISKPVHTSDGRSPLASNHPSARLLILTSLAITVTGYAHLSRLGVKNYKRMVTTANATAKRYESIVRSFRQDTNRMVRNWELAPPRELTVQPDDAVRTHAKADEHAWEVFVFSDFECPGCKQLAKMMEERIQPLFAGRLKMIYRHYPLNSDCNANVKGKMHKYACAGAAMAESAQILGDKNAFWEAHDFLFANRDLLSKGQLNPDQVASHLGFDPASFATTMKSQGVARRIWTHVNEGASLKLRGTPRVFVQGKMVHVLAATDIQFWDAMAAKFWKESGEPRPESTKLSSATSRATKQAPNSHDTPHRH